jgi:6-phosphogluconolactonase
MKKTIKNFNNMRDLSLAAAKYTANLAGLQIEEKGYFTIALSGGKTVIPFYKQLARQKMPWDRTYIFWQDDRFVKYGDKDSNVKLVYDSLIAKIKIPFENIYPAPGPSNILPVSSAAKVYEMIIKQLFLRLTRDKKMPSYDLIIAGMGEDGHTASLFPGDKKALNEKKKLIISVKAPPYAAVKDRITMTLPLINNAENILFLAVNKGREEVLKQVIKGNKKYPAALIKSKQKLNWYILK